jgi:hypothetical protein
MLTVRQKAIPRDGVPDGPERLAAVGLADDGYAAIGIIAIETTWIEYQISRLVVMARGLPPAEAERQMRLLLGGAPKFAEAEAAVDRFHDSLAAGRARAWLVEAKRLREMRHQLVHSIVMQEHLEGFTGYWPRTGQVVSVAPSDLADLAERVKEHAADGTYLSLTDWPGELSQREN